eukprot:5746493-Prymnesium_polylepis.1
MALDEERPGVRAQRGRAQSSGETEWVQRRVGSNVELFFLTSFLQDAVLHVEGRGRGAPT